MLPPRTSKLHDTFFARLEPRVVGDDRIRAAWLEGSYGSGQADRYSDVDLHILLEASHVDEFREEAEEWLSSIEPLVLFKWLFNQQMINALTADGLRIDIWLHDDDKVRRKAAKVHLLYATPGSFEFVDPTVEPGGSDGSAALDGQIREFWRCIALLPSVLGRGELIVAQMGIAIEVRLLTDILVNGYDIERDVGVKKLNAFLPGNTRASIEEALSLNGLSAQSAALSHLRLAAILHQHGPEIATRNGFIYASELESAVLSYVVGELELIDLGHCIADAGIAT